jgi:hypothetical protein
LFFFGEPDENYQCVTGVSGVEIYLTVNDGRPRSNGLHRCTGISSFGLRPLFFIAAFFYAQDVLYVMNMDVRMSRTDREVRL